jgi:hypothetical protein
MPRISDSVAPASGSGAGGQARRAALRCHRSVVPPLERGLLRLGEYVDGSAPEPGLVVNQVREAHYSQLTPGATS